MKKIILRGFSKKFKGTQKLPAQKAPKIKRDPISVATEDFRNRMGDKPEFMGFSNVSASNLAAESVANKISIRSFDKSLQKALKETRKITATGIKGRKLKVKQPTKPTFAQTSSGIFKGSSLPRSKPNLKIAKGKGELKALKQANKNSEQTFEKVMQRYTSKTKVSPFKNRTAATKRPLSGFEGEQGQYVQAMRNMGFDTKDFYYGVPTQGRISKRHANYLDKLAKKKKW